MTPVYVPFDSLRTPVTWEVNGDSPTMSPQAMMQMAQQLLGILGSPLGPSSGLQIHPLVRIMLANGPLRNAKDVQLSEDEVQAMQQMQAQQAMQQQLAASLMAPPPTE